jgi:hypothetical protein
VAFGVGVSARAGAALGARKPNVQIDRVLAAQERVLASGLNVPPPPARFGIVRRLGGWELRVRAFFAAAVFGRARGRVRVRTRLGSRTMLMTCCVVGVRGSEGFGS